MSAKKRKKYVWKNEYDFDIKTGLTEKAEVLELKKNPTAIIYTRVSDKKQVTDGNGLESQEARCRSYADSQGIKVLQVFSDEGVSGADMRRNGMENAIKYLKEANKNKQTVSYFLCSEMSRISRSEDGDETDKLIARIEETGVEIYLASGFNVSDKKTSNVFTADIQKACAKNERLQIRDRSVEGSKNKLNAGEWIFTPPAGYERQYIRVEGRMQKRLVKVEPWASIIKEGLELFANGAIDNQTRLLEYFNEKKLVSNYHTPNPGHLRLMYVARLFEIEKLYFYAGYIFYPNPIYGVRAPVIASHEPLISLSTMEKILNRLNHKGTSKGGDRKDNSDTFPLRGIVYCPDCQKAITGWASKGKMGVYYNYYGCKTPGCPNKENIPVKEIHDKYEELLQSLTVKDGMIKLIDSILDKTVKEKNKLLGKIEKETQKEIDMIDKRIQSISDKIGKLSNEKIIHSLEEERGKLEDEKELLVQKQKDSLITSNELPTLYDRVKTMIVNPVAIWHLCPTHIKKLQAGVLFGGKIYYKKNEGFQTPQISVLHSIISGANAPLVSNGAGDETRTRNNLLGRQEL